MILCVFLCRSTTSLALYIPWENWERKVFYTHVCLFGWFGVGTSVRNRLFLLSYHIGILIRRLQKCCIGRKTKPGVKTIKKCWIVPIQS